MAFPRFRCFLVINKEETKKESRGEAASLLKSSPRRAAAFQAAPTTLRQTRLPLESRSPFMRQNKDINWCVRARARALIFDEHPRGGHVRERDDAEESRAERREEDDASKHEVVVLTGGRRDRRRAGRASAARWRVGPSATMRCGVADTRWRLVSPSVLGAVARRGRRAWTRVDVVALWSSHGLDQSVVLSPRSRSFAPVSPPFPRAAATKPIGRRG